MSDYFLTILLVLCVYPYAGYPVVLYLLTLFKTHKRSYEESSFLPKVSVIIPMFNEENTLVNKLRNTFELRYPIDKLEIIIGSDGSTDKTNQLLKQYEKNKQVSIFYFARKGKAALLNKLIEYATGEIVLFTDCDSLLPPNSIKSAITCLTILM